MLTLIVTIVMGVFIAYFATQNTIYVDINLAGYALTHIPLYLVVLASTILGCLLTWLVGLIDIVTSKMSFHSLEQAIKKERQKSTDLMKKVHQLELENIELKTKTNDPTIHLDDNAL